MDHNPEFKHRNKLEFISAKGEIGSLEDFLSKHHLFADRDLNIK